MPTAEKFRKIGVEPGKAFDASNSSAAELEGFSEARAPVSMSTRIDPPRKQALEGSGKLPPVRRLKAPQPVLPEVGVDRVRRPSEARHAPIDRAEP
jgi:hypothetical protein